VATRLESRRAGFGLDHGGAHGLIRAALRLAASRRYRARSVAPFPGA
jgi:hypothetical protein